MQFHVRPESASEKQEIFNVNAAAFGGDDEARLVDLLRQSEAFIPELSLVAVSGDHIIGHLLLTKIKIINARQEHESLALAPMAVLPEFQRMSVGSQLIKKGLLLAKAMGYHSVIVHGHPEYYPKFGFSPASKWNISSPYAPPDNVFMAIELQENALRGVSGMVKYADAFNTL